MKIARVFHPVGQGAYYTETHSIDESRNINFVYDCGSTTLSNKKMKQFVETSFLKDTEIEILFISHFHADHINGIEYLHKHTKIKTVIIPQLNNEAKTLCKINNALGDNYLDTRIIDDPRGFFGDDVKVIEVIPFDDTLLSANASDNFIDIETLLNPDLNNSIPSGTPLRLTNKTPYWNYIPYNISHKQRSSLFVSELANLGISNIDIFNDVQEILNQKKLLIKAYKKLQGDLNANTMVLISTSIKMEYFLSDAKIVYSNKSSLSVIGLGGCLYLGDIDLDDKIGHSNERVDEVISKLSYYSNVHIGTVQVAHHGSIHNHSNKVFNKNLRTAIISYGTNNSYGHPSTFVVGDIAISTNCCDVIHITESKSSIHNQIILEVPVPTDDVDFLKFLKYDLHKLLMNNMYFLFKEYLIEDIP
ncbi:MBL fold metallo-hydrolase [Cellulophaga sp. BC115SP]|uniref:MBL fold metallo-hydrolase n=1 Tax=Cellulophaga sp. BC115SP TaxID=2683263 RepID=UPI0014127CDA|nr:MBL fold metallo-hydrolase [Cellulophaga sp. BC115SP]NBB31953.1 MBL fold metallo-hydrolase [Cellulophaga sp. BC115SP]